MEFTTAVLCIITGLAVGALVGFTYHKKSEEKKIQRSPFRIRAHHTGGC